MVLFSGAAYANGVGLQMLIQEIHNDAAGTVYGLVLNDNGSGPFGDGFNADADADVGEIEYQGVINQLGAYYVTSSLAKTGGGPGGNFLYLLTTTITLQNQFSGPLPSLRITLLDDGYTVPTGYSDFTFSAAFGLSGSPNSIGTNGSGMFQTWLDVDTSDPSVDFGPDAETSAEILLVPPANSIAAFATTGTNWGATAGEGPITLTSLNQTVLATQFTGTSHGLITQVEVQLPILDANGQASFDLTGMLIPKTPNLGHSMPEPTTLLLLISGLAGMTLVRRKKD
jgi:hypothetical protein